MMSSWSIDKLYTCDSELEATPWGHDVNKCQVLFLLGEDPDRGLGPQDVVRYASS